jgi:bifunctional ADP-heptose synthase (sugar kinase/adenylyltransferase)
VNTSTPPAILDSLLWLPRLAGRRVLVVGDVFLDTYIHAGAPLEAAARLANAAAGVAVGKVGTASVFQDELRRTLVSRGECV